jgi:hypothetical protein
VASVEQADGANSWRVFLPIIPAEGPPSAQGEGTV